MKCIYNSFKPFFVFWTSEMITKAYQIRSSATVMKVGRMLDFFNLWLWKRKKWNIWVPQLWGYWLRMFFSVWKGIFSMSAGHIWCRFHSWCPSPDITQVISEMFCDPPSLCMHIYKVMFIQRKRSNEEIIVPNGLNFCVCIVWAELPLLFDF